LTACLRKELRKQIERGLQPSWTVKLPDWAASPTESLTLRKATTPSLVLSALKSAQAPYYTPTGRLAVHSKLVPVFVPKSTRAGALGSSESTGYMLM
jgi:hypothetical protein